MDFVRTWIQKFKLSALVWIGFGALWVWLGWLGGPWFWEIDLRVLLPKVPPIPFSGLLLIFRGFVGLWVRSRGSQSPVWIALSYLFTLLFLPVFLFEILGFQISLPGAIPLIYLSQAEEIITPLFYQSSLCVLTLIPLHYFTHSLLSGWLLRRLNTDRIEETRSLPVKKRKPEAVEVNSAPGSAKAAIRENSAALPEHPVLAVGTAQNSTSSRLSALRKKLPSYHFRDSSEGELLLCPPEYLCAVESTLSTFKIPASIERVLPGPSSICFQIRLETGARVKKLIDHKGEFEMALQGAPVRFLTPVPGTSDPGIEIPAPQRRIIELSQTISQSLSGFDSEPESISAWPALPVGRDVSGEIVQIPFFDLPHLLIAGCTGSGKSVLLESMIASLCLLNDPSHLRLMILDPKRVDHARFRSAPHLLCPILYETEDMLQALDWLVDEMIERFGLLEQSGARELSDFSSGGLRKKSMPRIVLVIDELADIMLASKEAETSLRRLSAMGRAAGIHLLLSTQRPTVEVLPGTIRANIPGRVALKVSSAAESRIILDQGGAESLGGRGDFLFQSPALQNATRGQAAIVGELDLESLL